MNSVWTILNLSTGYCNGIYNSESSTWEYMPKQGTHMPKRLLGGIPEYIELLEKELSDIEKMEDNKVCEMYNVDYKHEAIQGFGEEIEYAKSLIEDEEVEDEETFDRLDPAFSSWEQVNSMFV